MSFHTELAFFECPINQTLCSLYLDLLYFFNDGFQIVGMDAQTKSKSTDNPLSVLAVPTRLFLVVLVDSSKSLVALVMFRLSGNGDWLIVQEEAGYVQLVNVHC
jgi:hypothetical protein